MHVVVVFTPLAMNSRELFPNYKEAITYYDICMLHYSNDRSMFGINERLSTIIQVNVDDFSDVNQTSMVMPKLFHELRDEAASGGSLRKYATGEALVGTRTIYALVQCTPDLQEIQCTDCLDEHMGLIETLNLTRKKRSKSYGA